MASVSMDETAAPAGAGKVEGNKGGKPIVEIAIVVILALYFGWEAYFYTGLFAVASDWQIAHFDRSLPSFTFAVLYGLALSIAFLILAVFRRRSRKQSPQTAEEQHEAAVAAAHEFGTFLFAVAAFAVIAAVALAIWTVILPSTAIPVRIVAPGTPAGASAGSVQTARVSPDVSLIATFSNDFSLSERNTYFVPLLDPANPRAISYLAQVVPSADWNGRDVPNPDLSGTFQMYKHQVPGFLQALYRRAGKQIANPTKLLTKDASIMQFPLFGVSILILLAGAVVGLAGLVQRRYERRLKQQGIVAEGNGLVSET